jgi:hypothetical protein
VELADLDAPARRVGPSEVKSRSVVLALIALVVISGVGWAQPSAPKGDGPPVLVPRISGPWRVLARNPDLGELTSPRQQPVDFGIWRAADGTWQLWSCIRYTKEEGRTRVFHAWRANDLRDEEWQPLGVAMRADPDAGELPGGLMAPFVLRHQERYWMFYSSGLHIALALSDDGKTFRRHAGKAGSALFSEPLGVWDDESGRMLPTHARDAMVLPVGDTFHAYYTADPEVPAGGGLRDATEGVYARESKDLVEWGPSRLVRRGGSSGSQASSSECPFVVRHQRTGDYYLFTTQRYGEDAQTSVYRSTSPLDFGVDRDDGYLVTRLPVAAPEIVEDGGRQYIVALLPSLQGIQLAPLEWEAEKP